MQWLWSATHRRAGASSIDLMQLSGSVPYRCKNSKITTRRVCMKSALPSKADMCSAKWNKQSYDCDDFLSEGHVIATVVHNLEPHYEDGRNKLADARSFQFGLASADSAPHRANDARAWNAVATGPSTNCLKEARIVIEQWRKHYNMLRPRSALGYQPPALQTFHPIPFPLDQAAPMR
jgi:hypothetical protein